MKPFLVLFCLFLHTTVFAAAPPEADRRAILAMAGEFEVLFNFEETVGLAKDYKLKDAYQEEATELVLVIEDTGPRIVLQHLLQMKNKEVIKHWTQTWTWQDTRLVEFQGKDRWKIRERSEDEARGTWSQLVTQVDDSPRYEGFGRWRHDLNISVWESNRTARPLPRREHTTRSDYHILMGVNRHALTPHGWVHEQDNLKLVLDADGNPSHYLAREQGVNHYDQTTEVDFAPARDYWRATVPYWKKVSATWESIASRHAAFSIRPKVDDRPLWKTMFALAEPLTAGKGGQVPESDEIEAQINRFLEVDSE